jgi:two-component system phosphate regulon sensor histidine kinase PhoR
MTLAAGLSFLALLLTARALRASAVLTSMRSDFVATVTHELKTPLALIHLVGETLARGRYTSQEKVNEYAELLSHEAVQLGDAIDNLLSFARYSNSGHGATEHLKPNSLSDIVEDALERFRPRLQEGEFEVSIEVPHDLPPVAADRPALIHAVQNIVDNAIKYASTHRTLKIVGTVSGSHVKLTIADTGMGIPKEEMPHIFEQFYRGQNATNRGSGLGLAIVRRVLSYHGGTVGLRSSIGNGTEVDLMLPRAR